MDNDESLFYDPEREQRIPKEPRVDRWAQRRQSAEMPYADAFEAPGQGLLLEYLKILRRRKVVLILATFLGLLAAFLLTLPQTPIYQARASIEIQSLNDNFLNMRDVSPTESQEGAAQPDYDVQTQIQILQSDSVLEGVIAKLQLNQLPAKQIQGRLAAWRKALGPSESQQSPSRDSILAAVRKNLTTHVSPTSRLAEIFYDSPDSQLAANFVNALMAEFMRQNVESRWQSSQQTGEWLTQQMEDVRGKLEQSEDALQTYAQASSLLFTSEKDDVAEDKLRQLQEELSRAQADRVAAQSKYELASAASPESLPEVLDDQTLKEYQVKLTDLHRQVADLSSSLTPAHPAVKKLQAQVTSVQAALETERSNVVQRIDNEFQSAQSREKLLSAAYNSQASFVSEQAARVAHYNVLKREVDTNTQLYDSMLHNVQEASMNSALRANNIRIVDSAVAPSRPYKPSFVVNSALGAFAGAFVGIAFIFMQERANTSLRDPGEAGLYLDVPELGVIPSLSATGNKLLRYYHHGRSFPPVEPGNGKTLLPVELASSDQRPSPLADAFRTVLTSILYSEENGNRPRIIVVTSPNPNEGKTTVASNLALALAEIGAPALKQPVLLIDAGLRRPRLHQIFGVPNRWGLSDLLQGVAPPENSDGIVFKTDYPNLFLLPSGSPVSNSAGLLHSPQTLSHFNRLRREFQTIIIDTPPMLYLPDARVLGRFADGVVLVLRSGQTIREDAASARLRFAEDGTRVLGTILNHWEPNTASHRSYTNSYGSKS